MKACEETFVPLDKRTTSIDPTGSIEFAFSSNATTSKAVSSMERDWHVLAEAAIGQATRTAMNKVESGNIFLLITGSSHVMHDIEH